MSRCSTGATSTSGGRGGPAADVALVQLAAVSAAAMKTTAAQVPILLLNKVLIFLSLQVRSRDESHLSSSWQEFSEVPVRATFMPGGSGEPASL
jgi:hypothetical protein